MRDPVSAKVHVPPQDDQQDEMPDADDHRTVGEGVPVPKSMSEPIKEPPALSEEVEVAYRRRPSNGAAYPRSG